MRVVPDTSVWVDYLRHGQQGQSWHLDDLLRMSAIAVCGPVVAELLAGTRQPERSELWSLLRALPWTPLGHEHWRQAGEVAAVLREHGISVPLTDVEIAVSASAADATVWTRDRDFERMVSVLPQLKLYQP